MVIVFGSVGSRENLNSVSKLRRCGQVATKFVGLAHDRPQCEYDENEWLRYPKKLQFGEVDGWHACDKGDEAKRQHEIADLSCLKLMPLRRTGGRNIIRTLNFDPFAPAFLIICLFLEGTFVSPKRPAFLFDDS